MASTVFSAQYANHLLEQIKGRKGLEFNIEKCMYLIMGSKKARKTLKSKLERSPLTLCEENMKEVKVLRYLGDEISFNLEESVHQAVIK